MAGPLPSKANIGSFVPTTNVWDVNQIYEANLHNDKLTELLVRLYQNINNIAINLNLKDTGYYDQQEFVSGQKFFPNPNLGSTTSQGAQYRQSFRMVVNCGPITASTTYNIPHHIPVTNNYSFTRIYGVASVANLDATSWAIFAPMPYASATAGNIIELWADNNNVNITTGATPGGLASGSFNQTYVVLEYIKQ